ncbi:hypothetical protein PQX77_005625 [Marasmius sp. AFHP31]|nr:hypothetical protein PQX77_005625 [Marasmius sp. AFHP31]
MDSTNSAIATTSFQLTPQSHTSPSKHALSTPSSSIPTRSASPRKSFSSSAPTSSTNPIPHFTATKTHDAIPSAQNADHTTNTFMATTLGCGILVVASPLPDNAMIVAPAFPVPTELIIQPVPRLLIC